MKKRNISKTSLIAHIKSLRVRHREIDARIDTEQMRPSPDTMTIRYLKKKRLGLRDAISGATAMLRRNSAGQASTV
ncbi:YdcH family protein [Halovulum sp. GXIMD14793]